MNKPLGRVNDSETRLKMPRPHSLQYVTSGINLLDLLGKESESLYIYIYKTLLQLWNKISRSDELWRNFVCARRIAVCMCIYEEEKIHSSLAVCNKWASMKAGNDGSRSYIGYLKHCVCLSLIFGFWSLHISRAGTFRTFRCRVILIIYCEIIYVHRSRVFKKNLCRHLFFIRYASFYCREFLLSFSNL